MGQGCLGAIREDFPAGPNLGERCVVAIESCPLPDAKLEDFNDPRLDLRPSVVGAEDVIGNVYEYLLERFASDAGKKAGEFYTPGQVSTLLARLLAPKKGNTICDPACGSGSLLIKVGRQADERNFALWVVLSNPGFKPIEFERFKIESGSNYILFTATVDCYPFKLSSLGERR